MMNPKSWIQADGSGDCPHCGWGVQFDAFEPSEDARHPHFFGTHGARLIVAECPRCKEVVIEWVRQEPVILRGRMTASGVRDGERLGILPKARKLVLSDHIDEGVRRDLEEAHAVASISQRAAAVLARRALQNALRLAGFKHSKSRDLFDEIDLAKNDPRTPSTLHELLDAVRTAGNDSAHPNRDWLGELILVPDELVALLLSAVEEFCDVYFVKEEMRRSVLDAWKGRNQGKPPT